MKYCVGAAFMTIVCCLWLNFRYFPLLHQSQAALTQCQIQLANDRAHSAAEIARLSYVAYQSLGH